MKVQEVLHEIEKHKGVSKLLPTLSFTVGIATAATLIQLITGWLELTFAGLCFGILWNLLGEPLRAKLTQFWVELPQLRFHAIIILACLGVVFPFVKYLLARNSK